MGTFTTFTVSGEDGQSLSGIHPDSNILFTRLRDLTQHAGGRVRVRVEGIDDDGNINGILNEFEGNLSQVATFSR